MNSGKASGEFVHGHVKGLSMWPSLIPGDILRAREVRAELVSPGDLLVLPGNGVDGPAVHRLVSVKSCPEGGFILLTAGDRGGADAPRVVGSGESLLKVDGMLRRGRWRKPPAAPPSIVGRLPGLVVRVHCALVRRLCW